MRQSADIISTLLNIRSGCVSQMNQTTGQQANAENRYEVHRSDLPVSCPLPSMALWNSHPRVYLPLEEERECNCPYCGARFVLVD